MPSPGDRRARSVLFHALLTLGLLTGADARAHGDGAADADVRIAFAEQRLAAAPSLHPAMNELALAYLDKAKATFDPAWVKKAREMTDRSLAVQETFEALRARMMIESYAHRFEEAARFGQRAAAASANGSADPDPEIRAGLVEIHLALGRNEDAERYVPSQKAAAEQLEAAWARAQWEMARGDAAEAARLWTQAIALGHRARSAQHAGWAAVAAAQANLARGDLAAAAASIEQARTLLHEPETSASFASAHAQLLSAQHQDDRALAVLERALTARPRHGELHRQAFAVARRLARSEAARQHFVAAESAYRAVIDAGEAYTIGALARLYLDAGEKLEEAKALAFRNLEMRRDPEAHRLAQQAAAAAADQDLRSGSIPSSRMSMACAR
ncbi:MAG TPA: hypothetical protein VEC57_18710 [Candidatus Limnocylindrales bacterium]|nr:hypothetical protein [Candidatus Limnocylindrales bacterium]